jgi:hypothetical protein
VTIDYELCTLKLGSETVPDFLRVFWNSQNPLTRHSELFKVIRGAIKNKANVFGLLRDMDRDADIYAALGNTEDGMWSVEQKKYITALIMFNVRQPYPLLLAARRSLVDGEFTRVLRACAIISFRYNVIGNLATSEQERTYNSVAEKIARKELTETVEIFRALRPIYPSDEQFRSAFAEKQIRTTTARNRQVVRYILFEIERQVSTHAFDYGSDKYNIEHVLPEHPGDSWTTFKDEQIDLCIFRIGNMTLLTAMANRNLANMPFAKKRQAYETCEFEITRLIGEENQEWTAERIAARQRWLANQATAIWRIAELS